MVNEVHTALDSADIERIVRSLKQTNLTETVRDHILEVITNQISAGKTHKEIQDALTTFKVPEQQAKDITLALFSRELKTMQFITGGLEADPTILSGRNTINKDVSVHPGLDFSNILRDTDLGDDTRRKAIYDMATTSVQALIEQTKDEPFDPEHPQQSRNVGKLIEYAAQQYGGTIHVKITTDPREPSRAYTGKVPPVLQLNLTQIEHGSYLPKGKKPGEPHAPLTFERTFTHELCHFVQDSKQLKGIRFRRLAGMVSGLMGASEEDIAGALKRDLPHVAAYHGYLKVDSASGDVVPDYLTFASDLMILSEALLDLDEATIRRIMPTKELADERLATLDRLREKSNGNGRPIHSASEYLRLTETPQVNQANLVMGGAPWFEQPREGHVLALIGVHEPGVHYHLHTRHAKQPQLKLGDATRTLIYGMQDMPGDKHEPGAYVHIPGEQPAFTSKGAQIP